MANRRMQAEYQRISINDAEVNSMVELIKA
jgi:hypothetical protein